MDVLSGLIYLHSVGIIHSDLKPENVLISPGVNTKYRAQLCDFGLSVVKPTREPTNGTRYTGKGATLCYAAPEQVARNICSTMSDIFSLGGVAYFLITGKDPFEGMNSVLVERKCENCEMPTLPKGIDEFWQTIFENCWVKNPENRIIPTTLLKKLRKLFSKL